MTTLAFSQGDFKAGAALLFGLTPTIRGAAVVTIFHSAKRATVYHGGETSRTLFAQHGGDCAIRQRRSTGGGRLRQESMGTTGTVTQVYASEAGQEQVSICWDDGGADLPLIHADLWSRSAIQKLALTHRGRSPFIAVWTRLSLCVSRILERKRG